MKTYRDEETGYEIRVLTDSPNGCTKPYFDMECTTPDGSRAMVTESLDPQSKLWLVDVETGEKDLLLELGPGDTFSVPPTRDYGLLHRGETRSSHRCDLSTGELEQIGETPFCGRATSVLTTFQNGTLVASYQHERSYYVLGVTELSTGKCEVVYRTDQLTNHTQACPGDNESILHIHETGGDAIQRMWMFNYRERINRPYFVEQLDDLVTHECWTRSGKSVMFCNLGAATRFSFSEEPDELWLGRRDGQGFRCVAKGRYLHGAPDTQERWIVADDEQTGTITLVDVASGEDIPLASGLFPPTGAEHCHPSFNRRDDRVILTLPLPDGTVQVGAIDLRQVAAWAEKM